MGKKHPALSDEDMDVFQWIDPETIVEVCTAHNKKPPGVAEHIWVHPDFEVQRNFHVQCWEVWCPHCMMGRSVFDVTVKDGGLGFKYLSMLFASK